MARLGRNVERYVYHAGKSAKARIRKTPLSSPAAGQWYLGAYNFDGGEVNLPCPHASIACSTSAVGKTFYLFDDLMTFELGSVAKLSGWLAEMWRGAEGYALPCERIEIPEAFAVGVGNTHPPRSTEDTTAWVVGRRDSPGNKPTRLRDLFEINILSSPALARTFTGQTLEAWIRQEPERGRIERRSADVVLWTIELQHLGKARKDARDSGITYPVRRKPGR
jgi:hypothetical protein